MILSRVADGLYWMGRYLERAENTTRLLLVTEELSTEVLGLDEQLARCEWDDVRGIFPGFSEHEPPARHLAGLAATTLLGLSVDPENRYSVFHSLKKARDNARSVRRPSPSSASSTSTRPTGSSRATTAAASRTRPRFAPRCRARIAGS